MITELACLTQKRTLLAADHHIFLITYSYLQKSWKMPEMHLLVSWTWIWIRTKQTRRLHSSGAERLWDSPNPKHFQFWWSHPLYSVWSTGTQLSGCIVLFSLQPAQQDAHMQRLDMSGFIKPIAMLVNSVPVLRAFCIPLETKTWYFQRERNFCEG